MVSFSFFRFAFSILLRHPKLFVPKLFVAVLYGFLMLATAQLLLQLLPELGAGMISRQSAGALLVPSLVLFGLSFLVLILDVWVSTWFPVLVSDFRQNKPLSYRSAIKASNRRFWVSVPLLVGVELFVSIVIGVVSAVVFSFSLAWFWVALLFSALVLVVLFVLLYPLLSVSVLERNSAWGSLVQSFRVSKSNWKSFSLPALLSFAVSSLNLLLAFLAQVPAFLVLFWLSRFVMALVSTYNAVLNPSAYLEITASVAP